MFPKLKLEQRNQKWQKESFSDRMSLRKGSSRVRLLKRKEHGGPRGRSLRAVVGC